MIIVKTKNGDRFINEKDFAKIEHHKNVAEVFCFDKEDNLCRYEGVECVVYVSDAQPVSWTDEGSEIQRLKSEYEKLKKDYDHMMEHSRFIREWFFIYDEAFCRIQGAMAQAERENKGIFVSPVAIIKEAEKKYQESQKKFEEAKAKWEE